MCKQSALSDTSRLFSTAGTFGEIQVVSTSRNVVIDVQGRNYDTSGRLHCDHGLAALPLQAAVKLRDLLSEAIDALESQDHRQPGLWSDSTVRALGNRIRGRWAA